MSDTGLTSSVRLLGGGPGALAVRLALADAAVEQLDLQYYLWHGDQSGMLLGARVLAAADRGVHVRLLLDDIDNAGRDDVLAAFNSHPRIEVRIFNPFRRRWLRPLEVLTRFRELNRRMHNKAMVADGKYCVVGGRNIGDAYFGLDPKVAFDDLDLLATGTVAADVCRNFEGYWQSRLAVRMQEIAPGMVPVQADALRAGLHTGAANAMDRLVALRPEHLCELDQWLPGLLPAEVRVLSDPPDKSWNRKARKRGIASKLGHALELAKEEVCIVSPYFVPRRGVLKKLEELRARGVRVRVLTNSLASNDVVAVHAGYAPKRRRLLAAGVELHELQPDAGQLRASGKAKIQFNPSGGRSSLHAKIFIIDRHRCFIGSFNLDPRSARLNTEMGLLVDCPTIASQAAVYAESLFATAYTLGLVPGAPLPRLSWRSPDGQVFERDPHAGRGIRLLVHLLSLLPIEAQL